MAGAKISSTTRFRQRSHGKGRESLATHAGVTKGKVRVSWCPRTTGGRPACHIVGWPHFEPDRRHGGQYAGAYIHSRLSKASIPARAISAYCSPVPPPTPTAPITWPSTTTGTPPNRLVIFPPLAAAAF